MSQARRRRAVKPAPIGGSIRDAGRGAGTARTALRLVTSAENWMGEAAGVRPSSEKLRSFAARLTLTTKQGRSRVPSDTDAILQPLQLLHDRCGPACTTSGAYFAV